MNVRSPLVAGRRVVNVSYHLLRIEVDYESVDLPAPADYSIDDLIVPVSGGFAFINTGINHGEVDVTAEAWDSAPPEPDGWGEVAEITVEAVPVPGDMDPTPFEERRAAMRVVAMDEDPDLPVLNPDGPGRYRVRVCANGRNRITAVDYETHEDYLIQVWPSPPEDD